MGLPDDARTRLAKVCGLLASDQDGERAAAALLATRLLRSHGLSWADLLTPAASPPPAAPAAAQATPMHAALAEWALRTPEHLTPWERSFLADIRARRRLTPRQASVLAEIVRELRERAA